MSGASAETPASCPNCGHAVAVSEKFCPSCGQKIGTRLITLREILGEFFDQAFNINSKFFATLRYLFVPGHLTKAFFSGQRIRFISPPRLFFVTLVTMYAILGVTSISRIDEEMGGSSGYTEYRVRKDSEVLLTNTIQGLGYDTLPKSQQVLLDTLVQRVRKEQMQEDDGGIHLNVLGGDSIILSQEEVFDGDMDSIFAKNNVTGFAEKLMMRQLIRANRDPVKFVKAAIGNTSWMILLLMPVLALVLKLLYIRRKHFFVQHIVFLYHYHAAIFVSFIVLVPLMKYLPGIVIGGVVAAMFVFLFAAMMRYYRQGFFKTFVKFSILLLTYFFTFISFSLITAVISLLIFQ